MSAVMSAELLATRLRKALDEGSKAAAPHGVLEVAEEVGTALTAQSVLRRAWSGTCSAITQSLKEGAKQAVFYLVVLAAMSAVGIGADLFQEWRQSRRLTSEELGEAADRAKEVMEGMF